MSDVLQFDVGVVQSGSNLDLPRERIRRWSSVEILNALPWLKRMNALDYDIFVRPALAPDGRVYPYAFINELNEEKLLRMKSDKHSFAILIEFAPGIFQGWVRLGTNPMDPKEVTACAHKLAETYGADMRGADFLQFGRLAGLTNRKLPLGEQKQSLALLREISNIVTEAARQLVEWVRRMIAERREHAAGKTKEKEHRRQQLKPFGGSSRAFSAAVTAFLKARANAGSDDEIAMDWFAVVELLRQGYGARQVAAAFRSAAPNLVSRQRIPDEDYLRRTIKKAEAAVTTMPNRSRSPRPRI